MKPKTLKQLETEVSDFNERYKIGDSFNVKRREGVYITKSEAYVLSGHSAVVFLEGMSGCYDISHLTKA